jgi:response regulator of citrate/malate metabolism
MEKLKRYKSQLKEDDWTNDKIDDLIRMILSKKFNETIYLRGLEALNTKYFINSIHRESWKEFKAMIMSYKMDLSKRNLLSSELIKEYSFLTD